MSLSTPVVLIVFNRPDLTELVFNAIAQAQPSKLLVVADGPRFPEETEKCEQARVVLQKVDWYCEVLTNFAEQNLGCRRRITSGLNWAFSLVEEAIILEDDCLPDSTFFRFCEELLDYYRDNEKVMHIGGTNLVPCDALETSFVFSRLVPIPGWATWRRAWQQYDDRLRLWPDYKRTGDLSYFGRHKRNVSKTFEGYYVDQGWQTRSWGARWAFTCTSKQALSIIPKTNLIRNLGFRPDATHTTGPWDEYTSIPVRGLEFPLRKPAEMTPDREFDLRYLDVLYGKPENIWVARIRSRTRWLWQHVRRRLYSLL